MIWVGSFLGNGTVNLLSGKSEKATLCASFLKRDLGGLTVLVLINYVAKWWAISSSCSFYFGCNIRVGPMYFFQGDDVREWYLEHTNSTLFS